MINLSKRAQNLKPSATLAMAAKCRELKARGLDVISFATGEPDFDTPQAIRISAKLGIDEGLTRYPPTPGTIELRMAICAKLKNDNGLSYDEKEIAVTCGAKHAIYNALQVICDEGDEVLIPAPYWVSYPDQVELASAKPIIVDGDPNLGFKLTPDKLASSITKKTRAIILNYPSNPSGSAYSASELKALAEVLVKNNVAIISDEIYEKLVYDGFKHTSIATVHDATKALTVVINGVSKAYAMTGWRMGYAAGPKDVIGKIAELVGQQITGIPMFIQKASIEALQNSNDDVERMRIEYGERRNLMHELIKGIPGITCQLPEGAFYLLPNISNHIGKRTKTGIKIDSADAMADYLLDSAHVATVSGDPFGIPGHIRLSYATSRENIRAGSMRIAEAITGLS